MRAYGLIIVILDYVNFEVYADSDILEGNETIRNSVPISGVESGMVYFDKR